MTFMLNFSLIIIDFNLIKILLKIYISQNI